MLVEKFGGIVPDNIEDLLTLPGVGRKTANVLLGNAFGHKTIGVDRHVARVSGRLGLTKQTDPDLIEEDLMKVVPEADRVKFCHLFQHHGRRICVARNPNCPECPINSLCPFPRGQYNMTVKSTAKSSQLSRINPTDWRGVSLKRIFVQPDEFKRNVWCECLTAA